MKIDYLAEHPEFVPTLSGWFLQEWPDFYADKSSGDVAETFHQRLNRSRLPLALVALEGARPLGTVSLIEESISTRKDLGPWLAGLYVSEGERGRGLGGSLVEAAVSEARRLGFGQLYIIIRRAEDYYLSRGWELFERTQYHGEEVTILRLDLRRDGG